MLITDTNLSTLASLTPTKQVRPCFLKPRPTGAAHSCAQGLRGSLFWFPRSSPQTQRPPVSLGFTSHPLQPPPSTSPARTRRTSSTCSLPTGSAPVPQVSILPEVCRWCMQQVVGRWEVLLCPLYVVPVKRQAVVWDLCVCTSMHAYIMHVSVQVFYTHMQRPEEFVS